MDKLYEHYMSDNPPMHDLVKRGNYEGFEFFILWFMNHPNAYIKIPEGHKLYEQPYDDIELSEEPHGFFTYSDYNLNKAYGLESGWYLGWDYAHAGDYQKFKDGYIEEGFKYSVEEIERECKRIILAIKELEDD